MARTSAELVKDIEALRTAVAATARLQHGNTVYGGEHGDYDCPCFAHTRLREVVRAIDPAR